MAKTEPEKGPIQIRLPRDLEAACERVRARGGDRSRDGMIARIVREADEKPSMCMRSITCALPNGHVGLCLGERAAKRKGAR